MPIESFVVSDQRVICTVVTLGAVLMDLMASCEVCNSNSSELGVSALCMMENIISG